MYCFSFCLAIISCDALLRVGFHALVTMALMVGFSSVHAQNNPQMYPGYPDYCSIDREVSRDRIPIGDGGMVIEPIMNENETIAKINPRLGKVLARLVKMQEQFPIEEKGEPNHGDKPPVGMKPLAKQDQEEPALDPLESEALDSILEAAKELA